MTKILKDSHFSVLHTGDIHQICSVLKIINIQFFHYIKYLEDGSQINLSTRPDWVQFFFNNDLYKIGKYENDLCSGFVFWDYFEPTKINTYVNAFQLGRGVTIIHKTGKDCNFYCFGSPIRKEEAINFYLSHMDALQKFIVYFNDKASPIINQALKTSQNRIIIPEKPKEKEEEMLQTVIPFHYLSQNNYSVKKNIFITTINTLRYKYRFNHNGFNTYLTAKELDCAIYLSQGKTSREIGEILHISQRTVETHLENLKNKFCCLSKQELSAYLRKQLDFFW
jgi:DNA-binding CsgD family transcriptional regulator